MAVEYPQIIGVGHSCQDFICTVEDYPPENGSTHITDIDSSQGGGAMATSMVAVARLGGSAGVMANLGCDDTGDRIFSDFEKEGICTAYIYRIPGGRSSSSIVMVNPSTGSRTKFPYRDDLPPIDFTPAKVEAISRAKILHLDGTNYENAEKAARIAGNCGTLVSLDGCAMQADNELNRHLVNLTDILITNARYPLCVTGCGSYEEALPELASLGPDIVITTLGENGCLAYLNGEVKHFPAFPTEVVDTTGAGDVFHGAFLVAYLKGASVEDCIRFASAAAAIKCHYMGGRAGILGYDEVVKFCGG